MSRVRQFGDMRQSRSTRKELSSVLSQQNKNPNHAPSHTSSAHSQYVCVNCVNKSLSQQKTNLQASRRLLEQSHYRQLQQSGQTHTDKFYNDKHKRLEQQKNKTAEYNKLVMQTKMQEKEKEKNQKQSERKNIESEQRDFNKQLEEQERRAQLQKERWRSEIMRQVQQKNQRVLRQQINDRYRPTQEDKTWIQNTTKEKQQKYRNELLNQIKAEQQKKKLKKDENNKDIDKQYRLLDAAEQRSRRLQLQQEERKRILMEDAKERQRIQEQKKIEHQMKLERERVQFLIAKECEEKTIIDNQKKKIERTNKYMSEIRNQMIEQERKKKDQLNWNKTNISNTSTSFVDERPIDEKQCDDCERIYPKSYLTKVKN